MKTRIGINGFGRIGRYLTRLLAHDDELQLVTVNDVLPGDEALHLLRYDSVHGRFPDAQATDGGFSLAGSHVRYTNNDPQCWNWCHLDVDIVVEAAGIFTDRRSTERHLACGAKRVVIAAPSDEADITVVMGVNEQQVTQDHKILSNASCTTNCLALPAQVIQNTFGIKRGTMTTIHPYTMRQQLLDDDFPDIRRARSSIVNILPTPVGTHKTVGLVLPELKGKLHGLAFRVPTANVALVDLVCELEKSTTKTEVNEILKAAANDSMGFSEVPLVSSDYTGTTFGSVIDAELTTVTDGTLLRLVAWYDNEASFTHQLLRLLRKLARDNSFH